MSTLARFLIVSQLSRSTGALTPRTFSLSDRLDPTTRRCALPSGKKVLVSDTVGFIQQLPSKLIAAFRATLEEISAADLLIHVVDVSSAWAYAHVDAVESCPTPSGA